jgi:hypothetical protein
MKRTLVLVNTIALIATIAINYLSNTGFFNGNTMETISDRYENYFTPAGYAFSIWGVIYLGLAAFVVYSWRSLKDHDNHWIEQIGSWFLVSCIANSLWIVAWLNDQLGLSVVLMIVLFVSLLKIILNCRIGEGGQPLQKLICLHWPFSIYFGWVSVAMIANIAAFLTKLGWDGMGISGINWTIIMVCVAGLVNLAVIWTRRLAAFGLVGVWAVIAIAASNKNSELTHAIVTTCYSVAGLLLVFIAIRIFMTRRATPSR